MAHWIGTFLLLFLAFLVAVRFRKQLQAKFTKQGPPSLMDLVGGSLLPQLGACLKAAQLCALAGLFSTDATKARKDSAALQLWLLDSSALTDVLRLDCLTTPRVASWLHAALDAWWPLAAASFAAAICSAMFRGREEHYKRRVLEVRVFFAIMDLTFIGTMLKVAAVQVCLTVPGGEKSIPGRLAMLPFLKCDENAAKAVVWLNRLAAAALLLSQVALRGLATLQYRSSCRELSAFALDSAAEVKAEDKGPSSFSFVVTPPALPAPVLPPAGPEGDFDQALLLDTESELPLERLPIYREAILDGTTAALFAGLHNILVAARVPHPMRALQLSFFGDGAVPRGSDDAAQCSWKLTVDLAAAGLPPGADESATQSLRARLGAAASTTGKWRANATTLQMSMLSIVWNRHKVHPLLVGAGFDTLTHMLLVPQILQLASMVLTQCAEAGAKHAFVGASFLAALLLSASPHLIASTSFATAAAFAAAGLAAIFEEPALVVVALFVPSTCLLGVLVPAMQGHYASCHLLAGLKHVAWHRKSQDERQTVQLAREAKGYSSEPWEADRASWRVLAEGTWVIPFRSVEGHSLVQLQDVPGGVPEELWLETAALRSAWNHSLRQRAAALSVSAGQVWRHVCGARLQPAPEEVEMTSLRDS